MPALIQSKPHAALSSRALGPVGPFPRAPLQRALERRWLHYAFVSRDLDLALVANSAWLGPDEEYSSTAIRRTTILLLHESGRGWSSSQFNAITPEPLWSAFRQPHPFGEASPLELAATAGVPRVRLQLARTSTPCTSQCAPFAGDQHLRWQSETGVNAVGDWYLPSGVRRRVSAVGYNERVPGYWSWPHLGEWVFGFANDASGRDGPPPYAAVFTFIHPVAPADATTASVMLWKDGRLRRHFPRRCVSLAVRGTLDRTLVAQAPPLASLLGVPPMAPVPQRLVIAARQGKDEVVLDFAAEAAVRIVIPSENALRPFSVHELVGACHLEGVLDGVSFVVHTKGIVEFAGGSGGD
jgi:hypothetical protein